jgi:hypothetical protein
LSWASNVGVTGSGVEVVDQGKRGVERGGEE